MKRDYFQKRQLYLGKIATSNEVQKLKRVHDEEILKLKDQQESEMQRFFIDSGIRMLYLLSGAKLNLRARVGKKFLPLSLIKKLNSDYSIEFDQLPNDPLELLVQNQIFAKGEVVIVDGNFGVQVTKIFENPIEDKAYYPEKTNKQDPMLLFESILGDVDWTIDMLRKIEKGTVIDLLIPAGSFSKLYADRHYIGEGEIKVYEKNLAVTFINTKKPKYLEIPVLDTSDREQFNSANQKTIISKEVYKNNFSSLNDLSADILFMVLSCEHPQSIAVTLLNLDKKLASEVLGLFHKNDSAEIIIRMSKIKRVDDESLFILSETLRHYCEALSSKESLTGFTKTTEILKLMDPEKIKINLDGLSILNSELSEQLKKGVEEIVTE